MKTTALLSVVVALGAAVASARIPVCIEVVGHGVSPTVLDGLEALVADEVRRHPSHVPAKGADCATTLHVDLAEVALEGGSRRVATVYLDGQVPHRDELGVAATFKDHLEALVSAALGTDPAALMESDAALADALSGVESRPVAGEMAYGVEVGQATSFLDGTAQFSPALALRVRRGLGEFHVGGRLRVAFLPVSPVLGGAAVPTVNVVLEPEFAWFVSPDAVTSFYLAAAFGVSVLRYDGYVDGDRSPVVDWGVHTTARMGVEFLRVADVRLDLFASATLPFFATNSDQSTLVDSWTPTLEVGFGVAF